MLVASYCHTWATAYSFAWIERLVLGGNIALVPPTDVESLTKLSQLLSGRRRVGCRAPDFKKSLSFESDSSVREEAPASSDRRHSVTLMVENGCYVGPIRLLSNERAGGVPAREGGCRPCC